MPDINGFDVLVRMKADERLRGIPRPLRTSTKCSEKSRLDISAAVVPAALSETSSVDDVLDALDARGRSLNQFTADATGRPVLAGPVEATALGNIAMQMLATGAVASLAEARAVIERSFPVERFEPAATDGWDAHYRRFQDYLEFSCV